MAIYPDPDRDQGKYMTTAKRRPRRRISAEAESVSRKKRRKTLLLSGIGSAAVVVVVLAVLLIPGRGGPSVARDFSFTLYQGVGELGAWFSMEMQMVWE